MHSMTGYGRCRIDADGREMTIELKTVNHRFLDINLRMPRGLLFLEDSIRKALSARLSRGHADVFVTYKNTRDDARAVTVDTSLLHAYGNALDAIAAEISVHDDRSLMRFASLPDVLSVSEKEDDQEAVSALCTQVTSGAIDALLQMRAQEGEALKQDTLMRLSHLESLSAEIAVRAPDVVTDYKTRLEQRIAELLESPPDPQRMAQEVALMADRAAIDEELVRLKSHIQQMRETLESAEPIGRKLDFLVQELNREVNTIGSKASDLSIGKLVVEGKAEIEKIREQVQNIE